MITIHHYYVKNLILKNFIYFHYLRSCIEIVETRNHENTLKLNRINVFINKIIFKFCTPSGEFFSVPTAPGLSSTVSRTIITSIYEYSRLFTIIFQYFKYLILTGIPLQGITSSPVVLRDTNHLFPSNIITYDYLIIAVRTIIIMYCMINIIMFKI